MQSGADGCRLPADTINDSHRVAADVHHRERQLAAQQHDVRQPPALLEAAELRGGGWRRRCWLQRHLLVSELVQTATAADISDSRCN